MKQGKPIGALRQRVELLQPVETADEIGGVARSFAPVGTVFGALAFEEGGEILSDERKGQVNLYGLVLRWRADLRADWRAVIAGRSFDIRRVVDPDGRQRWLSCLIEETVP